MRVGPYDGEVRLDAEWWGGHTGGTDVTGEWVANPNSWEWTRHLMRQVWFELRAYRSGRSGHGRITATLTAHFGYHVKWEVASIKKQPARWIGELGPQRSIRAVLRWANAIVEDPARQRRVLDDLARSAYGQWSGVVAQSRHLWRLADGAAVPFLSVLPCAGDGIANDLPVGTYLEVTPDGNVHRINRGGWGWSGSYGPPREGESLPVVYRWTRYHPSPPMNEASAVAA